MKYLLFLVCIVGLNTVNAQSKEAPKLVVGIVVDQMCYEYLYRFYDKYCEGGFKRLMHDGTNCRNALYNYVPTYTGPGHASIYTGTTPANHGIVGNGWYSRDEGKEVNCVGDTSVRTIGSDSKYGKYSPHRLKTVTITDQLKMTYPNAKVISASIKNRGAILPGGHLSDGSYWFDFETGKMISSSFFMNTLPNWVNGFNEQKLPDSYLEQKWETILPIDNYGESGPDDSPYEVDIPGKESPTFPYDLKELKKEMNPYSLFTYTPFSNTFLTSFAIDALNNESLGKDNQTDMLCISYSTPDIIGHAFGPYSIEIEDTYIRLDLELKRLLNELDKNVGEGNYTVFLTADHAVVPVPQYYIDHKMPGGYVYLDPLMDTLKMKVKAKFGEDLILEQDNLNIYLNNDLISDKDLDKEKVVTFIMEEIRTWEGVKNIYPSSLLNTGLTGDFWMEKVRLGYNPNESGEIIFILESGYLPKGTHSETSHQGTSHGSAYNYDSHVPLLWYGNRIPQKEIFETVNIVDITPTLAHLMNLQIPGMCTGVAIDDLLED